MLTPLKLVILLAGTIVILCFSLRSLRSFRSHGFYRFFAWLAMLVLILLNINYWFHDPLSLHQIISWLCLFISLLLVFSGVMALGSAGKPSNTRQDASLFEIEKTTVLVEQGAYRYVRHPLYGSLLFLAWGVFFKSPSWIGAALAVPATIFLTATAKVEETENIRYFGPGYKEYMKRTKMFIPFLF
jgi:protein-S-isoprenylcysteine O-methyltransferase Ste14